jgi:hypothetical protein
VLGLEEHAVEPVLDVVLGKTHGAELGVSVSHLSQDPVEHSTKLHEFSSNGLLQMAEGQEFHDNGERYLCPPKEARLKEPRDYSFGAVFLHRRDYW